MSLDKQKLIKSFEEIVGWPYVSPGSNDQNGIDCSGAFVRAYMLQGASIYHGSNTIFRKHCSQTGVIDGVGSLEVGMAVFKRRDDSKEPDKYKGDGHGNLYHIGLVVSVSPLRIIHATEPVAKVDTKLNQDKDNDWRYWGKLSDIIYGTTATFTEGGENKLAFDVTVTANSLNMRKTAGGEYMLKIPNGTRLTVLNEVSKDGKSYGQVSYGANVGWIELSFTARVDSDSNSIPSVPGTSDVVTVLLPREAANIIREALNKAI